MDIEASASAVVMGSADAGLPSAVAFETHVVRPPIAETTASGRRHAALVVDKRRPSDRPVPSAVPTASPGSAEPSVPTRLATPFPAPSLALKGEGRVSFPSDTRPTLRIRPVATSPSEETVGGAA